MGFCETTDNKFINANNHFLWLSRYIHGLVGKIRQCEYVIESFCRNENMIGFLLLIFTTNMYRDSLSKFYTYEIIRR